MNTMNSGYENEIASLLHHTNLHQFDGDQRLRLFFIGAITYIMEEMNLPKASGIMLYIVGHMQKQIEIRFENKVKSGFGDSYNKLTFDNVLMNFDGICSEASSILQKMIPNYNNIFS